MKHFIALVLACYGLLPLLATPQTYYEDPAPFGDKDVTCLAKAVYFEARGEPPAAQKAVAEVVLNRVDQGFAPSVCAAVYQRGQFSWASHAPRVRETGAYTAARDLSFRLLAGFEPRADRVSLYFYSGQRRPAWARGMWATARIGKHLFLW